MEGRGEGRGLFCSQKLPYLSTILSPVVGSKLEDASPPPTYKWIHSIASSEVE